MRGVLRSSVWLGAFLIAVATAGPAFAQSIMDPLDPGESHWYLRGGIGPELMETSKLTQDFSQPDVGVKFDPGFRLDVAGGCRFGPCFSLEGDTGLIYNSIESVSGSPATDANLAQVPLMVNAVFQLPKPRRLVPYIGGGVGVTISRMSIGNATVQGAALHGNDVAHAFAYQAFGGLRYDFTKRLGLSLAYEYLGSTQPEWDLTSFDSAKSFGTLVLRQPATHSLVAEVTVKF